jgi:TetR/AcrR family transcriptional regulator, tetracycline repressor protein
MSADPIWIASGTSASRLRSLYRHVRDKEDLLNEVVDRMQAEMWQPEADASDTWAWLMEAADRLRAFLAEQPAALHVFLSHPVTLPAALARLRSILGVLQAVGLDEPAARRLYAAYLHAGLRGARGIPGTVARRA